MPDQEVSNNPIAEWQSLVEGGNEAYQGNRYMEAELKFAAALRMVEKESHDESFEKLDSGARDELNARLAKSLNNMAALYHTQGKYSMAEDLYKRCLEIKERLFGSEHMEVAICLHNLAVLYSAKRRYELAEPLYRQSLELKERLIGADNAELVPQLTNYALLLKRMKKEDEAVAVEARIQRLAAQ